jgi:hypothetical protein
VNDSPIIIVGVGRSGSTIFHQVMCGHPSVTWLSRFSDRYPSRPARAHMLMQLIDVPVIGPFLSRQYDPGESYRFWDHYYRGFSVPCRDLAAGDVTPSAKQQLPLALAGLATSKRTRPLLKITGWPRLGYLAEVFPQARFIHVLRDGRAVANPSCRWIGGGDGGGHQTGAGESCPLNTRRNGSGTPGRSWRLLVSSGRS